MKAPIKFELEIGQISDDANANAKQRRRSLDRDNCQLGGRTRQTDIY